MAVVEEAEGGQRCLVCGLEEAAVGSAWGWQVGLPWGVGEGEDRRRGE